MTCGRNSRAEWYSIEDHLWIANFKERMMKEDWVDRAEQKKIGVWWFPDVYRGRR
jgi:hypothetical protein